MEDKEQNELGAFLGDLANGNEVPGLNFESEKENLDEKKQDIEQISDNKDDDEVKIPFHKLKKDPSFQRFVEKEINKKLKDQPQPQSRQEEFKKDIQQDEDPFTEALTNLIGDDTPEKVNVLKQFKRALGDMEKKAADTAYNKFLEEQKRAQEEEQRSIAELSEGIERIEENFEVDLSSNSPLAKKTRNEFLDFVEKISPKNERGEVISFPDLENAFSVFQSLKKPEGNPQAKDIASRVVARSAPADTQQQKRITFANVREMMGLE